VNVFDEHWSLIRSERFAVKTGKAVAGIELVVTFTEKVVRFEGARQFDVRSRASRTEMVGLAVVFGQPLFVLPDTFRLKDLCCVDFEHDLVDEPMHWLVIGLTGEAICAYDLADFRDDGLCFSQWLGIRLRRICYYFDTENGERYELSLTQKGQALKWTRLKHPLLAMPLLAAEGAPAKETRRDVLEERFAWEEVVWSDDCVLVRGIKYGPIVGYFTVKRKRPL
jgi:hypothetical protein